MLEACLSNSKSQVILGKGKKKKKIGLCFKCYSFKCVCVPILFPSKAWMKPRFSTPLRPSFYNNTDHETGLLKVGFSPMHNILIITMMCHKGLTQRAKGIQTLHIQKNGLALTASGRLPPQKSCLTRVSLNPWGPE